MTDKLFIFHAQCTGSMHNLIGYQYFKIFENFKDFLINTFEILKTFFPTITLTEKLIWSYNTKINEEEEKLHPLRMECNIPLPKKRNNFKYPFANIHVLCTSNTCVTIYLKLDVPNPLLLRLGTQILIRLHVMTVNTCIIP